MNNALDIISEACRTFGLPVVKSLGDQTNETSRRLLAALNRTAEELSVEHNWLSQTRILQFTLDKSDSNKYYNKNIGGYNLQLLTNYSFERFSSSYLYNMTDDVQIPGVPVDLYQKNSQATSSSSQLTYFRYDDYVLFFPNIEGKKIKIFYQMDYIASITINTTITEYDTITDDKQVPYHNERLLLRGVLLKYAQYKNYDTTIYEKAYNDYKDKLTGAELPKSSFGFINKNINMTGGFGDLG
jgi:hypothetical protein